MKDGVFKKGFGRNILILILVGAALTALAVYLWPTVDVSFKKSYSAVYLETGEVYFGRLSYFPRLVLYDAHTLQSSVDPFDPTQTTVQIVPLRFSPWRGDTLTLNRDKIVFIGTVEEESQVMEIIRQSAGN